MDHSSENVPVAAENKRLNLKGEPGTGEMALEVEGKKKNGSQKDLAQYFLRRDIKSKNLGTHNPIPSESVR